MRNYGVDDDIARPGAVTEWMSKEPPSLVPLHRPKTTTMPTRTDVDESVSHAIENEYKMYQQQLTENHGAKIIWSIASILQG
jgi:hypothetical protein